MPTYAAPSTTPLRLLIYRSPTAAAPTTNRPTAAHHHAAATVNIHGDHAADIHRQLPSAADDEVAATSPPSPSLSSLNAHRRRHSLTYQRHTPTHTATATDTNQHHDYHLSYITLH